MARVRISLQHLRRDDFPPVCAVCGRPADGNVRKTFLWRPRWLTAGSLLRALLLLSIVAWPFLFLINEARRRRATAELPMCHRHRRYWIWRGFWVLAPLLVLVVSSLSIGILALLQIIPILGMAQIIVSLVLIFLAWAVAAFIAEHTGLRAAEINKDELVLTGASQVFADLMQKGRRAWETTEYRDESWEDYDPYPRSKAPR